MLCSTSLAMILFTAVIPGTFLIYQLAAVVNAIRVSLASVSCSIGDIHVFNQNSKSIGVFPSTTTLYEN
jgi:hypothetical protein